MLDIVKTFPKMGGSSLVNAAAAADDVAEEEMSKEQKGE